VLEATGMTAAGVTAAVGMADAQTVPVKTPATPTRRSWKPNRTPSIPATGTPAAPTRAGHVRARPTCPSVPRGPGQSATCPARPDRRARRDRRHEIRPRPTTAPGSLPRALHLALAVPGRRPGPGPGPLALVPGSRGHRVLGQVRGLPISRTIPPPGTPHHLRPARPDPRQRGTGARNLACPGGRSTHDSKDQGPSSPMPRAAIRTGPRRQAGNSTAERSVAPR